MAALAVLLIAGGAVLAGWLALRQSQTESYLVVADTIHYGDQIERSDLRTIDLPADNGHFIPASEKDEVIDSYARVELVPDTVIAEGMYGDAPELATHENIVGLSVDDSSYPKTLKPGDNVIAVRRDDNGNVVETANGVVRGFRNAESGGGAVIDIVVSDKCADLFASYSSLDRVEIVEAPPNGRVADCSSSGTNTPGTSQ